MTDSVNQPRPGKLAGHQFTFLGCLQWTVVTLLLCLGYCLSFSHHFADTLDVAGRMQSGDIRGLYEFHHLIAGLLPFWLWTGLRQAGVSISALSLLQLFAFVPTVATLLLVFAMLRRLEIPALLASGATFAFATSWAFWMYVGTGRPYSTSMFFAVAAYYVALSINENRSEKGALFRIVGAALLVTLSCLFWLEQCFNCIGVGLLVALRPEGLTVSRRSRNLAIYTLTGIILTLAVLLSGFLYTGAVRTRDDIQHWIATGATPPMKFDRLSVMKASYGQAAGIIYLDGLSYMINGLVRRDPRLLKIGSLPWQLTKFLLAWLLALPIYLYPILAFRHSSREKKVILVSFTVPLLLNLIFALGFMGSDAERFLPSFGSLAVLGALGLGRSTMQLRWRHTLSVLPAAVLAFIAGVNLVEGALAEKHYFTGLARQMKDAAGHAGPRDFVFFFGRDFSHTYCTMLRYYVGASYLNLSADLAFPAWDRPDWQQELTADVARARAEGGRVFVVDRLALGENPISAAWSEVQHPKPTVQEVTYFLRTNFCLTPAWNIGPTAYWQLAPRTLSCSSPLAGHPKERR